MEVWGNKRCTVLLLNSKMVETFRYISLSRSIKTPFNIRTLDSKKLKGRT